MDPAERSAEMTMDHREKTGSRGDSKRFPRTTIRKRDRNDSRAPAKTSSQAPKKDSSKVWRADKSEPRAGLSVDDKILLAAASAKIGPGGYKKFSDIPAHKLGRRLRIKLYALTKNLPENERDNLVIRIKTASTAMTAALVTGFGQGTFRSGIAGALESRGALFGLQDMLDQVEDHKLIEGKERESLRAEVDTVIDSVNSYLGELARDKDRYQN